MKGLEITKFLIRKDVHKMNKVILLFILVSTSQIFALYSNAQALVTGTVRDTNGEVLIGVNVTLIGQNTGTITDVNGRFSLDIPPSGIIKVSYVGYLTQEVKAGNKRDLMIILEEDSKTLEEVVVVGYGTQLKKDLTGSISTVSSKNIESIPVSGFDRALQGQVAGLQISSSSGAPNGNTTILIRGIGSISGGVAPLFVIDGFPVVEAGTGNPLNSLNPGDIESIDVLKDASSTAIYGSRGSNGVIIVTTKKGKAGKPQISLNAYGGFQEPYKKLDMMNSQQFIQMVYDARNNGWLDNGGKNASVDDPNSVRTTTYKIPDEYLDLNNLPPYDTDFQDIIFREALITNYELNINGGSDKMRYSISGNYFDQDGIIIGSNFKRYSARSNVEGELTKKLKIGVSLLPSFSETDGVKSSGHYGGNDYNIILCSWAMPPTSPVHREDGTLSNTLEDYTNLGYVLHPLLLTQEIKNKTSLFRLLGNAFAEYELIKDLKFKVSFGVDFNSHKKSFFKSSKIASNALSSPASATSEAGEYYSWLNENTVDYKKKIDNHSFGLLGGFTMQKAISTTITQSATNFPDDLIQSVAGGEITKGTYNIGEWSLASFLARVNYNYNDKYLATLTYRTDGSSRFGENNRWGSFPSFSLAYRLSEEEFMKSLRFLNNLKLRGGYGFSGNNSIGNYRYLGLLKSNNYIFGNTEVTGLSQSSFTNNILGWETSKQVNLGLDAGFFDSRLQLTVDVYRRVNTDMLMSMQIPSMTGYTSAWVNIGELENKGLEIVLNGTPVSSQHFQWNSSFNISFNRNVVLALGTETEQIWGDGGRGKYNLTVVGRPIGGFYGHVAEGIFLTQEDIDNHATQAGVKLGDVIFRDVVEDGVIKDDDRDFIGSPHPDFIAGCNNTFTYKNWSLDILINGSFGNDVFWAGAQFVTNLSGVQNNLADLYSKYYRSPENPGDGKTPRAIRGGINNNGRFSSRFIYDGSYIRIRNVNLSYNLPQRLLKDSHIQAVKLYLTGANLFTFTEYPGYDPEISNTGDDPLSMGVDYAGYPVARSYTFGVNVIF